VDRGGADPSAPAAGAHVLTGPTGTATTASPTPGSRPTQRRVTTRKAARTPRARLSPSSIAKAPRPEAPAIKVPVPKATGGGRIRPGVTYRGAATFYGATGAGNCSYEPTGDLMVGAMNQRDYENSRACGAYLAVTGPGGKTITIKVVDRCPECGPGAIDLSREAFTALAPASTGMIPISWRLLSPALGGPVGYVYKAGSSRYWCGIQVRNHRNPIRSVDLKVGSSWKALARQEYNYFLSADGAGCGGTIRVTDILGHRLTDSGIGIRPGAAQSGRAQFPRG
jgi:expansin (peptidoglycan-binding protein)